MSIRRESLASAASFPLAAVLLASFALASLALLLLGGPARAAPAAASPAPTEAPPPRPAPEPAPVRLGVIGGVGFPRPLSLEATAELYGWVAIGVEYGVLPSITIDGVDASLWSLSAGVRVYPFRNSFFVGLGAGRQHAAASTAVTVPMFGPVDANVGLDCWFVNPQVGFLWHSREGITLGVDAGVQFPIGPTVSSNVPLSLDPSLANAVRTIGSSVLPTIDLLRLGLVL
jgi:hypothetical protein